MPVYSDRSVVHARSVSMEGCLNNLLEGLLRCLLTSFLRGLVLRM